MSDLAKRLINDAATLVRDWDITRELEREAAAEIERLNKRHDDFLQEFWKTNAENAKLQAVVDAADRVYADYEDDCNIQSSWMSLGKALAALEVDDE